MPPLRFWVLMIVGRVACFAIYNFGPPDRYAEGSRYYGNLEEMRKFATVMIVVSVIGAAVTVMFG